MSIEERWEKGNSHDSRSEELGRFIAAQDVSDSFCWKFGGDGDNGEDLLYALDIWFERKDQK